MARPGPDAVFTFHFVLHTYFVSNGTTTRVRRSGAHDRRGGRQGGTGFFFVVCRFLHNKKKKHCAFSRPSTASRATGQEALNGVQYEKTTKKPRRQRRRQQRQRQQRHYPPSRVRVCPRRIQAKEHPSLSFVLRWPGESKKIPVPPAHLTPCKNKRKVHREGKYQIRIIHPTSHPKESKQSQQPRVAKERRKRRAASEQK